MNTMSIRVLSLKTGLERETVQDLLEKGWTYHEAIDEPSTWIHPSSRLKVKRA